MKKKSTLILFAVALIILGVASRFIGHVWNFTILGGLAVFCGAFFKRPTVAIAVVLATLLLSDAMIGFYHGMIMVYFAFAVMIYLGSFLSVNSSRLVVVSTTVLGSFLFFLITNFFVWFEGSMYPQTLNGLAQCYFMGIEFYRNQLLGDVISSVVLFEVARAAQGLIATQLGAEQVKISIKK